MNIAGRRFCRLGGLRLPHGGSRVPCVVHLQTNLASMRYEQVRLEQRYGRLLRKEAGSLTEEG